MNAPLPATDYRAFLEQKIKLAAFHGFDVGPLEVHPWCRPIVQKVVPWMLKGGRRALFANFGLHKTSTQLECMRLIKRRFPSRHTLITLPLGVRQEFFRDAVPMDVKCAFIRDKADIDPNVDVHLTNYETVRDGRLDPRYFGAASLDEVDREATGAKNAAVMRATPPNSKKSKGDGDGNCPRGGNAS